MEQKKKSIELNFIGPYGFENIVKDLIHDGKEIEGIYLWAIKQSNSNRYLIHYIGESTKIIKRQQEHLIENSSKPCVFIGKPCDVAAISALRKQRPKLDKNLKLLSLGKFNDVVANRYKTLREETKKSKRS